MDKHIAVLEEMFALAANERRMKEADACAAAIALMRGQSEESEADALRRRLHKLADYWIGTTRDQDIAYKDRPLLEMYDKGLTKCATDLRAKLRDDSPAEGHSR